MHPGNFFEWQLRALIVFAICAIASVARAIVVPSYYCALQTCGYDVEPNVQCAVLPANHKLELGVTCGAEGLGAQLPELLRDDGSTLESVWQLAQAADSEGTEVYVRTGAQLPVGEVVHLVNRVPSSCDAGKLQGACSSGLICLNESARDCCSAFEQAGVAFSAVAELEHNVLSARMPEASGPVAPLGPLSHEYARFRVVEPDLEPPPEVSLRIDCRHLGSEASQTYAIDLRVEADDLTDAVRLELFARDVSTGILVVLGNWTASRCVGQPAREFWLDPISMPGPGQWQLFVRSHDAAGNTTDGPMVEFGYPDQCSGVALTAPNNSFSSLCGASPYGVEDQADWCGAHGTEQADGGADPPGEGGAGGEVSAADPLVDLAHCDATSLACETTPLDTSALSPAPGPAAASTPATTPSASETNDLEPRIPRNSCGCALPGQKGGSGLWWASVLVLVGRWRRRAQPGGKKP